MSREVRAPDERRDPYRFCLATPDDTLREHADPLPMLDQEAHFAPYEAAVRSAEAVAKATTERDAYFSLSSRSLGMLISSRRSTRLLTDSSS